MIGKNNPLNIRYKPLNNWIGQTGQTRGFSDFDSIKHGVRAALYLLIKSYPKRKQYTYAQLISSFAPSFENPTDLYISFVCRQCDCFPFDVPSSPFDYARMVRAMWQFEQGNLINCPSVNDLLVWIKEFDFKNFEV